MLVHYVHGIKRFRLVTCDSTAGTCSISQRRKNAKTKQQKIQRSQKRPTVASTSSSVSSISKGPYAEESQVETHFIRVCELTEGAIFNVGELFERRRVVADTNTHCLLIPRYWLVKMNKDNIWSKVQQFLNKNIPSTRKIFDEWIKEKKFMEYRKKLVRDILAAKNVSNTNCIHNVPYSIRLKENPDAYSNY